MATTIDRTNYNALVDDSGGNADGTIWSKNQIKIVLLDAIDALFNGASVFSLGGALALGTYSPTVTGTKNDWDIDTDNAGITVGILRCNNATDLTITGFKGPSSWRVLYVFSVGAGNVYLKHQNASSTTAGDRLINFATTGDTPLAAGVGWAKYIYDVTTARWRLVLHEQGAFIDYSATATITGWSSRTTTVFRYKLSGRRVDLIWDLEGTSNATTVSVTLPFTSIAGPTQRGSASLSDNGVAATSPGLTNISPGSATLNCYKDMAAAAWTNVNSKFSVGQMFFEAS